MRRYWIDNSQIYNDIVSFKGDQFHHIFDVCRQEVGHHFEVITKESKAYLVQVTQVLKKEAQAKIVEVREIPALARPHIHIALSISRYPVMDSILERAVEMGVTRILPFVSDYSFIRKTKELPAGKTERWQKIIVSATQQCGRGELLQLDEPVTMAEMLKHVNPNSQNWCLFAYEGSPDKPLKPIQVEIKSQRAQAAADPENIWVIIGSEGGFSTAEVETMQKLGLHPVTLGAQILRVETACLTLVSVLKYEFGLMK